MEGFEKLSAVARETLEEKVYKSLWNAIISGSLDVGRHLVQEDLARQMGTSRIPVRDALKRLEADGLIATNQRGNYYVLPFGVEDVQEIYALRSLLEPYAASEATALFTEDTLSELRSLTNEISSAAKLDDRSTFATANRRFHLQLYLECGMPRLIRVIEGLWSGRNSMAPPRTREQMVKSAQEHHQLMDAVDARDSECVRVLLREHIVRAGETLIAGMEKVT